MVAARLSYLGTLAAGCPRACVELTSEERRPAFSTDVSESSALRHRMGSCRCGHVLLRLRFAIFPVAQTVARPADCLSPARAGQADVDDQRNHESAASRPASWKAEGRREG